MSRGLLLVVVGLLACSGPRGPDPVPITPESIAEAARVLSEVAEKNPDFALDEGGFRVRASTYTWVVTPGMPTGPHGGGGGPVVRRMVSGPRTTRWRLEDIESVESQKWLLSSAVIVRLRGNKEPWIFELDDPEEAHRIVNALDLLRRGNLQEPGGPRPPAGRGPEG